MSLSGLSRPPLLLFLGVLEFVARPRSAVQGSLGAASLLRRRLLGVLVLIFGAWGSATSSLRDGRRVVVGRGGVGSGLEGGEADLLGKLRRSRLGVCPGLRERILAVANKERRTGGRRWWRWKLRERAETKGEGIPSGRVCCILTFIGRSSGICMAMLQAIAGHVVSGIHLSNL